MPGAPPNTLFKNHRLNAREVETLRGLAETLLPRGGPLEPGASDVGLVERLERYFSTFDKANRSRIRLILFWFHISPIFSRELRPFTRLSPEARARYVGRCLQSRFVLRKGTVTFLKQLAMMAYVSDPEIERRLGYDYACIDERPPRKSARLETIGYPEISGRVEINAQVCVIGSGAGGAVAAKELAEGGLRVVVLEEGDYFTQEDFTGPPFERMIRFYRRQGATAAIGKRNLIPLPMGKAVGGTTVVNSGTCFRTPEKILSVWEREFGIEGIDAAAMAPLFERVEEICCVKPVPWEIIGENAKLFHAAAEAQGLKGAPIRRNIDGCRGCGVCAFGCPSDAKQAMHLSYLPRAQRAGAVIYKGVRASRILTRGGRACGVEAEVLDLQSPHEPAVQGTLRVKSDVVILAAGAIHTPNILLRNRLANRSGQVGRNLTIHPSTGVAALFDREIYSWRGTLQSYYLDAWHESHGIMIEVTAATPSVAAGSVPGFGLAAKQHLHELRNLASTGLFVSDSGSGRVIRALGKQKEPLIFYSLNRTDAEKLVFGMAKVAEIYLEAGAKRVMTGLSRLPFVDSHSDLERLREGPWPPSSLYTMGFHPMGTCRMGAHPQRSVVDGYGKTHDVEALFITDASIFPTCTGVNPQQTIMAFATRTARHLLE